MYTNQKMLCKILYSVTAPFAVFKHRTAMKEIAAVLLACHWQNKGSHELKTHRIMDEVQTLPKQQLP